MGIFAIILYYGLYNALYVFENTAEFSSACLFKNYVEGKGDQ